MAVKKKPRRAASKSYARITRKTFRIDALDAAPYNARSISQEALRGLKTSLTRLGLLAFPIVNVAVQPPRIVGGHQRIRALAEMGVEEVQCVVVRMDEATERHANFALNNPHIEGTFVPSLTRELLDEISGSCVDAEDLFSEFRLDTLIKQAVKSATASASDRAVTEGHCDDDEVPPYTSGASAVSTLNRTYRLGDHLIYCGRLGAPYDIRDLGLKPASMAITGIFGKKEWSADALRVLLSHMLLNTDGACYVAAAEHHMPDAIDAFFASGSCTLQVIVAHDSKVEPSDAHSFRVAGMPILYGWRTGVAHAYYGGLSQGNVWSLKRSLGVSKVPVEVAVRAMQNSSIAGEVVLDPHVTDGGTVIAAEKTGRKILGIAPSARDMDRIRRRWTLFAKGPKADWRTATKEHK